MNWSPAFFFISGSTLHSYESQSTRRRAMSDPHTSGDLTENCGLNQVVNYISPGLQCYITETEVDENQDVYLSLPELWSKSHLGRDTSYILVIHFLTLRFAHFKMCYPKNVDHSRSFISTSKSQVYSSGSFSELMCVKNIFDYHSGKLKCIFRDSWKLIRASQWSEIKEWVLEVSNFRSDI